jgi:hypothetical protein
MNPTPSGGAPFTEVGDNLGPRNGFDLAAFQIVVTAVEHVPRLRELRDVPSRASSINFSTG